MGIVHLRPDDAPVRTLADYADDCEAPRYVCPPRLAPWVDRLLDDDGPLRVLTLVGRAGVGKSAALRAVRRRVQRSGRRVVALDARTDDVLARIAALRTPGQVLVVDAVEQMGPALSGLGRALAALPHDVRVVVAGRTPLLNRPPEQLEQVCWTLRLDPLDDADADLLLRRHGVDDPDARQVILTRAAGLPLALVVHARAWFIGGGRAGVSLDDIVREGEAHLFEQLAETALARIDRDLLAVLAVSAGVDAALLTALFPGRQQEIADQLAASSVVETIGDRFVLHPSLTDLLARRLRGDDPELVSAAVLRVAAHEHDRAAAGDVGALTRLAGLVEDPALRAGLGTSASPRYYADGWRPDDIDVVRPALEALHPGAWRVVSPWLGEDARVVRRVDGSPVALVAALPMTRAGDVRGPRRALIGPVLTHARETGVAERAVLTALQVTFAGTGESGGADGAGDPEVARLRNAAGLAAARVANPRSDHVNLVGDLPGEHEVLTAYGYVEVPRLRRSLAGVPVTTWVADVGPGGLAGVLHAAVLEEQGRAATDRDADLLTLVEGYADADEPTRAWIRCRVEAALRAEPQLHDLVLQRYLTDGATHQSAMRATFSSRATYFRRLRRARDLLTSPSD